MRSLRLAAAILALALVAAACSDDPDEEAVDETVDEVTATTESVSPPTTQPRVTPTTAPEEPPTVTVVEIVPTPDTTEPPESGTSVGPPPPPSNVRCQAGTAENELLVEFDALPDPSNISKIRVYVSVDGGPMITNGEFDVGQVDTARSGGDRWAARARRLPADVPLRLTATSFNLLGQESGWHIVGGLYTGAGAPCGTPDDVVLPPTTCTAGCDEEEGEPGA